MTVTFITSNTNKFAELQHFIPDVQQLDIDLPEIQSVDSHDVIRAKLTAALAHHDGTFVVEDTSLVIHGLNGLPGPLVKWFLKTIGLDGLYTITAARKNFRAVAVCTIGYATTPNNIHFFTGEVRGTIVPPRGSNNFGWDAIFQPEGYDVTFAEMSQSEKNTISHRRKAAQKLATHLQA